MPAPEVFAKTVNKQIAGIKPSTQTFLPCATFVQTTLVYFGLVLSLLSFANHSHAENEIVILNVTEHQQDKQLLINSQTEFNLPEEVIEAIHHEVPIRFKTQIELTEEKRVLGFKYQRTRNYVEYRTELYAYGVNRLYTLYNNRNQKAQTFKTLEEALKTLATLQTFPVASLSELHPEQRYTLRVRISLDYWSLPAPMILEALFTPHWQLDSQWFETELITPLSWQ